MKIIYILKKGLQCYPPCLAQVLYLNDLGIDLTVYHGKNSAYIDRLLKDRGIENYTLQSDQENAGRWESYLNFLTYTKEMRKIISGFSKDAILWFGNCESIMTLGKCIRAHRFVLTVLELYEPVSAHKNNIYYSLLKKIIPYAEQVICCEKHRAVIMKNYYSLPETPHVIPNKPYMLSDHAQIVVPSAQKLLKEYPEKKFVLYQGIIGDDRPIDNIARALNRMKNDEFVFVIMGKASSEYQAKIQDIYSGTVFLGYIPAPEHLKVTERGYIGTAIYDDHNLNNQFCAPNKIYEYSAFGIPMITSLNLGLTETVGAAKAGKCVDFKNVDEIVTALQDISSHYDEYSHNALDFYHKADCGAVIRSIVHRLDSNFNQ